MSNLDQFVHEILRDCLPQTAITDADRSTIAEHRDFLLGIEDALVQMFYDTLYAHGATAAVFIDGERPAREATLRDWWGRTVTTPLDDRYLTWMALVGVVHIRRKVTNPMMLTMFNLVAEFVHRAALAELGAERAERLRQAFSHLAATVTSVISESYTKGYLHALQNLAGLDPKLVDRMLLIEVRELEANGRAILG